MQREPINIESSVKDYTATEIREYMRGTKGHG